MKQPYGRMSTKWMPPKSVHIMTTNHQKPFPLLSFLFLFFYVMYFPPLPTAPLFSFILFWLIGLQSQSANIIMNKKLFVCENIPERAQTTHHHPAPLDGDKSSPMTSGPMDLFSSHEMEIWKF